jgi:tRNA nucleotidyltransferase (CCA-adding enzyme)
MDVNLKSELESALSEDHLHLLYVIADVAGTFGYPIYLVGGSVRDLILGRPIHDFDLTVEGDAGAFAESMLRKLGGKILIHSKFGTARWTPTESTFERLNVPILQPENFPPFLDFVTARFETYSQPGALPTIKKSSINDDLRRRDFTINAMAIRLDGNHFGELVDPLHGQRDIEDKLIRILHKQSFIDDPTRMFRAIRYAMRYGFELASETRIALNDNEALNVLAQLSGERIRHELDLIFEEDDPLLTLAALEDVSGFTKAIHPALENSRAMALSHLKAPPNEFGEFVIPEILSFRQTLGWVLYLMELSATNIDSVAERLAFPVKLTMSVGGASSLLESIGSFKDWKPSQWTFHLDELPSLSVYAVWLVSSEKSLHAYLEKWQHVKAITTGDDLKQLGLEPGPKYKEILDRLRAAWLDGEVTTREEEYKLRDYLIAD